MDKIKKKKKKEEIEGLQVVTELNWTLEAVQEGLKQLPMP